MLLLHDAVQHNCVCCLQAHWLMTVTDSMVCARARAGNE